MRPILVATDGSEGAERAVETAAAVAGKLNVDLWILNVIDGFSEEILTQFTQAEKSPIGDAIDAIASRILAAAEARAKGAGASAVHLKFRSGDCTSAILETAREIGARAIFVGRRGRGAPLGATAGKRLSRARKPIRLHVGHCSLTV